MSSSQLAQSGFRPSQRFQVVHIRVVAVAQRARHLHLRKYEGEEAEVIQQALSPTLLSLLQDAIGVLKELNDFSRSGEDFVHLAEAPSIEKMQRFELAMDELALNEDASRSLSEALQDISFIASLELKQWQARLEHEKTYESGWVLLEEYDSVLRRIVKSLTAAEKVLSGSLNAEPLLDFASELRIGLEIRQNYTDFRTFIRSSSEPTAEDILPRLRGVGTRIAMLVGKDVYASLRIGDRQHLHEMQQRILAWLRGESDFDFRTAIRLWQDIESCINLFSQVSARQELIEHDRGVIERLWQEMFESETGFIATEEHDALLQSLYGLDDAVHHFTLKECKEEQNWRVLLQHLQKLFVSKESRDKVEDFFI